MKGETGEVRGLTVLEKAENTRMGTSVATIKKVILDNAFCQKTVHSA